jgi:bacterioferritin
MKGNADVIATLNHLLADEFTAIHTYVLHAEMCDNWGYKRLASFIMKDAIDEMGHAEKHLERLLFLEGEPDAYTLQRVPVGKNVMELLESEAKLERGAIAAYNAAIATAAKAADNGSREHFEKILRDEEGHELFLRTQLEMIRTLGLPAYLAEQMQGKPAEK